MRKKFVAFGLLFLFAGLSTFAQKEQVNDLAKKSLSSKDIDTVAWVHSGSFNFGVNQGLLHNWAAGGELASLAVSGLFDGTLTHYNHRKIWTTNLNAAYGLLYTYSNDFIPRKTDDRIDLTSRYGYKVTDHSKFYLVGLLNAMTQFTKGYDYANPDWSTHPVSDFLAPLYVTVAPGMEYRAGTLFSLFFSPLAARGTFVSRYYTSQDSVGAYGVPYEKTFRFQLGAYLSARFNKKFSKHFSYATRLDLYSNYLAKDTYRYGVLIKKDNPGNIDILWDNHLTFTFAKYFAINLAVTAIYDNDVPYIKTYKDDQGVVHPKDEPMSGLGWWQVKEIMNIGFNYKF